MAKVILTIGMLVLLYSVLQPEYRGGYFLIYVLLGTCILYISDLVREFKELPDNTNKRLGDELQAQPAVQRLRQLISSDSDKSIKAFWITLLAFVPVAIFGVFLGSFVFLLSMFRLNSGATWQKSFAYALIIGIAIPYGFARVVSINLWTGAIPTVVPGFIGGGILPIF